MKRGDGKCYTQFDSISNEQYIYIYMDAKTGIRVAEQVNKLHLIYIIHFEQQR